MKELKELSSTTKETNDMAREAYWVEPIGSPPRFMLVQFRTWWKSNGRFRNQSAFLVLSRIPTRLDYKPTGATSLPSSKAGTPHARK
jgi:hypothetical protein